MLKKILEAVKRLSRTPVPFDPSRFEDTVADTTDWGPAKRGGASFCTHKLVEVSPHRVEFKITLGAKLFAMVFLLIGLGMSIGFSFGLISRGKITFSPELIFPTLIGLIFAGAGGFMCYYFTRPIVFDRHKGYFWKGRGVTDDVIKELTMGQDKKTVAASLGQIHALQLISEYCRSNKSSYYSYELNLVLRDGERINVVDHGKLSRIVEDANALSAFLGKPVWNAAGK